MENTLPLTLDERLVQLKRPFWIGYPRAQTILQQMEDVFLHPKMHRMPNLAVIGETNNGKTMLLKTFYRRHQPDEANFLAKPTLPILMLQAPPEPDEGRLYADILAKLFSKAGTREPAESMLQRIRLLLSNLDTRMIILDEFQHTLAGTGRRLRRFLNSIKYLGNELQIPIVVAGTPETLNVLQSDPQVANRFEPQYLPKWALDEDYLRLLATIEPKLGLANASQLHVPRIATRLYDESEGTIGELMKLLHKLSEKAMRTGSERISEDMVSHEQIQAIGWRAPSIRNRYLR